jgi:hypothetical protein
VIAEAVGAVLIVGVALFTVSITVSVAVLLFALSIGVKVTEYAVTPLSDTDGFVVPAVHEKVPAMLADPPVSIESESVFP